jgi:CheY-like chemotaxis protein
MNSGAVKPFFKKVLVIDDNETDRYIANRIITKHHFAEQIVLVESGQKALDYLSSLASTNEEPPQFIFLDIRMPEMDGFDFLKAYDKLPEHIKSNSVIMMLSTSLDQADLKRAESSPYINRFLNKPLNREKIEQLEQEFIARKAS